MILSFEVLWRPHNEKKQRFLIMVSMKINFILMVKKS